jgi:2-haloacid dehalogenase
MSTADVPDPPQAAVVMPAGITTLVFDVLGTVVDEAGSIAAETTAALASATATAAVPTTGDADHGARLAGEWLRRLDALTSQVAAGEAPWRSNDALRRAALLEAAGMTGLDGLPSAVLDGLALAGHRLRPWPDSPAALRALAGAFKVVALSNADLAQLADMSAAGGLAWHGVLSAGLVRAYKPDPAVYQMALDLLGLDPAQTMMIAAHPWDLRAAAEHGLHSAYVARPGAGIPAAGDRFDVSAASLADLAELLAPGAG